PAAPRRVLAQHRSAGEEPPVLRPRRSVPHRHLLSRRAAAGGGAGLEGQGRGALRAAGGDADRPRRAVLQGGRVSPGLSPEESDPLQVLPVQLRARRAARGAVGQEGLTGMIDRRLLLGGAGALALLAGLRWLLQSEEVEAADSFEIEKSDAE